MGTSFFLCGAVENASDVCGFHGVCCPKWRRLFNGPIEQAPFLHFEIAKAETFRQNFREHSGRKISTPVGLTAE